MTTTYSDTIAPAGERRDRARIRLVPVTGGKTPGQVLHDASCGAGDWAETGPADRHFWEITVAARAAVRRHAAGVAGRKEGKMSWAVGYDSKWKRDIGYGVPSICDHPECGEAIDRGLAYVCGGEPYSGEEGCGLFFCGWHMQLGARRQQCERCTEEEPPFEPTPDTREWMEWKLADESWGRWRDENPAEVEAIRVALAA